MFHAKRLDPSRFLASGALMGAIALGAFAVPASTLAKSSSPVVRATGSCSAHSTAHLKAKHDSGRIEVEFEVDQNRNNRSWTVRIWDDGHRVFTGVRTTHAPSGSFSVQRLIANRAGLDSVVASAVNRTTGEVCRAVLKV
jgi:hypothetical protein